MRCRTQVIYAIVVLGAILGGWESFSRKCVSNQSTKELVSGNSAVLFDATGNLKTAIEGFPPHKKPRVLVLGSSQIATVKDGNSPGVSFPYVLQRELQIAIGACEVVDLSTGGQSVLESVLILMGSTGRVRPNLVVIGVSLYGMQGVTIRDSIRAAFDIPALAKDVMAHMPKEVSPSIREDLLSFRKQDSDQKKDRKTETIQQKTDRLIGKWISTRSSAYRNRQLMFDRLIDEPIRRDLVAFVKRKYEGMRVARTYRIESPYHPSMASIRVAANWCRKHSIGLLVVVLPYDSGISPIPYLPEEQNRFLTDIKHNAKSEGFRVLDLGHALPHEQFGLFVDGSPDGLHFRAAGHKRVGKEIADFVAGEMRPIN